MNSVNGIRTRVSVNKNKDTHDGARSVRSFFFSSSFAVTHPFLFRSPSLLVVSCFYAAAFFFFFPTLPAFVFFFFFIYVRAYSACG